MISNIPKLLLILFSGFTIGALLNCFGINPFKYNTLDSNTVSLLTKFFSENTSALFTGFWGGLFAGIWGYYYQSKNRNEEKRSDKYFDHRNTIVQIEHEIIPIRVNISRNLTSLDNAIENTNELNTRVVLRFFPLNISRDLSLHLLNLEIINMYAELYTHLELLNSDFQYITEIVNQLRNATEPNPSILSLERTYIEMLPYIKKQCEIADNKTLNLLIHCKLAISTERKSQKSDYIKSGGHIDYNFSKDDLNNKSSEIIQEENLPEKHNETRPQFIALFFDIRKTISQSVR